MYTKMTIIAGNQNNEPKQTSRNGHWSRQACINAAQKMNLTFPIIVTHSVLDGSGKGRSGRDCYELNEDGSFTKASFDQWGGGEPKADFI